MARALALAAAVLLAPLAASPALSQELKPGESPRIPGVPFHELARRAGEAAEGGRLVEAVRFYRAGLELNPLWAEGWWRLALIRFDAGRYEDARDALRHLVTIEGQNGPSWALLGLSEYELHDYDDALASLTRATALGVPEEQALGREAIHYDALLLIRSGAFADSASQLARLVLLEPDDPELVAACGLMALRMRKLPSEVEESQRDLVRTAGLATHAAFAFRQDEARRHFEELVTRFPTVRGVHYAFGLFLLRHAPAEALAELQKEVELHPDHVDAHLEIAYAILDRGDAKEALPSARAAARLAPDRPSAHFVLGRALVAHGELEEGIRELERSASLDPDNRDVQLALAQAYSKAGRTEDVERARARLQELDARLGAH